MQFTWENNPWITKWKCIFNAWNSFFFFFFVVGGGIDLVSTKEITNIRLQVRKFELQIATFYVQSVSLFA